MLSMLSEISGSVGCGINSSVCTLVGQQIGKGNSENVKSYRNFIIKVSLFIFIVQFSLVLVFSGVIFDFMTNNTNVLLLANSLQLFFSVNTLLELVRMGLLRGFAKVFNLNMAFVRYALISQWFV